MRIPTFIIATLLSGILTDGMMGRFGFAETTFTGSTIEALDTQNQSLTIRTIEGKTWSLPVAESELMQGLKEGDRASLELDLDGKVKAIVKSDASESTLRQSKDKEKDE